MLAAIRQAATGQHAASGVLSPCPLTEEQQVFSTHQENWQAELCLTLVRLNVHIQELRPVVSEPC